MSIAIDRLQPADVRALAAWRYPPPYDIYNIEDAPALASYLCGPARGYFALRAGGELVGFCCFGGEGQVPGGDYSAPALDIGIGVRPDLTGHGRGREFMGAVLAFAAERYPPQTLRLTVAAFNARARRLYRNLGFQIIHHFIAAHSGRDFVVMLREPAAPPAEV
jgi:RimJ/RimL family protein N-acetyltransferase